MSEFLVLLLLVAGVAYASWCAGSADGYNEALRDVGFFDETSR